MERPYVLWLYLMMKWFGRSIFGLLLIFLYCDIVHVGKYCLWSFTWIGGISCYCSISPHAVGVLYGVVSVYLFWCSLFRLLLFPDSPIFDGVCSGGGDG